MDSIFSWVVGQFFFLKQALPCPVWLSHVLRCTHTLMYIDGVDSSLAAWMTSLMSSPILSNRLMRVHAHAHTVAGAPAVHSPSSSSSTRCRFYELPWAAIHLCHTLAPLLCSIQHFTNWPADGIVLLDIYCFHWLDNDQMLYLCSNLYVLSCFYIRNEHWGVSLDVGRL